MAKFTSKELYDYVVENPGCYANDIAKAKGIDRTLVLSTFRTATKIGIPLIRQGGGDELQYFVSGMEAATIPTPVSTLSEAIQAMLQAITAEVRQQIDEQLDSLITAEVDAALADVQNRIRARLAGATAMAPATAPVTVAPSIAVAPPEPPRLIDVVQPTLPKPAAAIIDEPELPELPEGSPVIHNVKSKRTTPVIKTAKEVVSAPKQETEQKKKQVVIIGIHANKQPMIRQEYKDLFDLRMLNPDQYNRIKDTISPTTKNFVMIDFVAHRHSEAIKSLGLEFTPVTGGMSTLRSALTDYYLEDEENG